MSADLHQDIMTGCTCLGVKSAPPQVKSMACCHQTFFSPLPITAIVLGQDRKADSGRIFSGFAQLRNEDKVAARLTHFVSVEMHHARMNVRLSKGPVLAQ